MPIGVRAYFTYAVRFDKRGGLRLQSTRSHAAAGPPAMAQEESSMPVQIGINGFGRIGRIAFRALQQRHGADLKVVAINDLVDAQTNAHLLKYDTNYGPFPGTVAAGEGTIIVNGEPIRSTRSETPPRSRGARPARISSSSPPASS